jgi:uncharacterized membrane protein
MKGILTLIKAMLQGGLLVLLPILLFVLILIEIVEMLVLLATPIADLLPHGTFDEVKFTGIIAIVLLLGLSLLIGIFMQSNLARRWGNWFEKKTFGRLPAYRFVKILVTGLIGSDKADEKFKPALLSSQDGQKEICYLVEDHKDDYSTVMVPLAPAAFAGSVKIVKKESIQPLDADLSEVSLVLNHLGLGGSSILGKKVKG